MGRKSERDIALDAVIGKAQQHIDGRMRGRRLVEMLAERYPQQMKLEIRRLEGRMGECLAEGSLTEDDILLMQLEIETSALRTVLGWKLAEADTVIDSEGKITALMSPFLQMTRILLQVINTRRRINGKDDGDDEDTQINVKKLITEMASRNSGGKDGKKN